MLMLKTQIGLGVLGIPVAFDALGLIPGVICLCTIAGIVTWSNYIVGVFKRRHPEIYSISDVGQLIFGWPGNVCLSVGFVLCELALPSRWMTIPDSLPKGGCSWPALACFQFRSL